MQCLDVHPNDLKSLLKEIARREIRIRIKNQAGDWSPFYYSIDALKDLNPRYFDNTYLVLKAAQDESAIIDIRSLKGILLEIPILYGDSTSNEFLVNPEWQGTL
ncbi:hypothetical protein [Ohtaekwangia sp.]|uniref:hypothetical protein n=1 Tax=Ohtaekwangia sp. TaxID=2066019 RepID=UPI002F93E92D